MTLKTFSKLLLVLLGISSAFAIGFLEESPKRKQEVLDKFYESEEAKLDSKAKVLELFVDYFVGNAVEKLDTKTAYEELKEVSEGFSSEYPMILVLETYVDGQSDLPNLTKSQIAEHLDGETILKYTQAFESEIFAKLLRVEFQREGEEDYEDKIKAYVKLAQNDSALKEENDTSNHKSAEYTDADL